MNKLSPFEKAACVLICACMLSIAVYFFTTQVSFCSICRTDPAPGTYLWDASAGTLLPLEDCPGTVRFPDRYDAVRYCSRHRPASQEARFQVLTVLPTTLVSHPIREAGTQADGLTLTRYFDRTEGCWAITVGR